jgi:hypothetical protein
VNSVPAIVMTKDSYRPFTLNMILSYEELWPDHPLEFFVPYQDDTSMGPKIHRSRINFIQTAPGFRDTVLTLLEGLGCDDWVYFCIDDKFPTRVNASLMSEVFDRVRSGEANPPEVAGLAFTRSRAAVSWPDISIKKSVSFGQQAYRKASLVNFWFHQLVRVQVLLDFFQTLPAVSAAKEMDFHVQEFRQDGVFLTTRTHALSLSESTSRGRVTASALKSLQSRQIDVGQTFLENGVAEIEVIEPVGMVDRAKIKLHDLSSAVISREFGPAARGF